MSGRGYLIAACAVWLAGCQKDLPDLPRQMMPEPPAADVEMVIFLVGDAGDATIERFPVIERLRQDVEEWSGRLREDTSVIVLWLGDNVYPDGLDSRDEPAWERDSAVLQGQVDVVAGPNARRRAVGLFMAGNHDWGDARGPEGVSRLHEQELFLERASGRGVRVELQPEAGEPGPALLDVGRRLRLLIYDTPWWLLATDQSRKARVFRQTEDALRSAGERTVIFASHHPYSSASSHGGHVAFWKTLGVRFLLARSGAILQDLNSVPYREFTTSLLEAFRAGPPFIWAGGHDHSLQVIRHEEPGEPRWSLVSGSGSKVSRIGHMEGMQYRHAAPGYMKLFVHLDGSVDLFVVAAPGRSSLSCLGEGEALRECMTRTVAGFETTFGARLR